MENIQLLTKIATLYYKGGLNQQEIANRLGLSRQTTGRYLKRALDLGIVTIKIQSTLEYSVDLEYQLESIFGLSEVIVVTPPTDSEEAVKEALGSAGAAFLERRVQPGDIIGISWSSTVFQCAMQLAQTNPRNVTVVQLNGSMDRTSFSTRAEFIVERIAQAFEGKTFGLLTPMLVDDRSIKESFLRDSKIAATLQLASDAQLALFGVGNVSEQSSLYKTGYLDDAMLGRLQAAGAVGEICGRFYDRQGEICLPDFDERTIAVELKNLKSKRISAAIAAGLNKVEALLGMLRGGFCNVLITSEETAQSLLMHSGEFQASKKK
jgi:deoxyribonucleoside regulator